MCVFTSGLPMCSLQDYPWSLSELLSGAAVLNFVSVNNTRSCDTSRDDMDSQCKSPATTSVHYVLPLHSYVHSALWTCNLFKHSVHSWVCVQIRSARIPSLTYVYYTKRFQKLEKDVGTSTFAAWLFKLYHLIMTTLPWTIIIQKFVEPTLTDNHWLSSMSCFKLYSRKLT